MELQSSHVSLYGLDLLGSKKRKCQKSKLFTENEKAKEKNVFQTGINLSSDSLIFNTADTCGDYSDAITDHCCRNAEHHLCKAAYFSCCMFLTSNFLERLTQVTLDRLRSISGFRDPTLSRSYSTPWGRKKKRCVKSVEMLQKSTFYY